MDWTSGMKKPITRRQRYLKRLQERINIGECLCDCGNPAAVIRHGEAICERCFIQEHKRDLEPEAHPSGGLTEHRLCLPALGTG